MIIEIGDKLVSSEVFTRKFVCDLTACKGACCIQGDAGAPLKMEEVSMLEAIYPKVESYLTPQGKLAIEEKGVFYFDQDNDPVTTLMEGGACAFTIFDEEGVAKCSIEKAYEDGVVKWKKPISCELFPIRVKKYPNFEALNFDEQKICKSACSCGEKLDVPVFRFLKKAIIRAYGEDFFHELEEADKLLKGREENE
jgi:hypothetical protein